MNFSKRWKLILPKRLAKKVARAPGNERERLRQALRFMEIDVFSGDFRKLGGGQGYRRRVGEWRIVFDIVDDKILVNAIERRTSTTYKE